MADTQITGTLSASEPISGSLSANEGMSASLTPDEEVSGMLEVKRTLTVPTMLNDLGDVEVTDPQDGDELVYDETLGQWVNGAGAAGGTWGTITGTLSDQTDLQTELDEKYSINDTAETTIDDADYFPYYDTSATAKRKSLWSNIKSVLKAYFVSLFVIEKTKAQYDALPSADKNDPDKVYYVPDYEDTSKTWVRLDDTTTANDKVWSSSKVSSELSNVAQIDDTTTSSSKAWSSTKIQTEINGKLAYSENDTTGTVIDDADFVPYYDYSESARQKITFANIVAKIKTKLATVATTGSYNDLSNKPTIPAAQIQSDWNQTTTTAKDYIKNKPTIPAAQVNSDWTSSSGVSEILHKPTLGTAAALDVASTGDASSSQVVKGNDTRLTDARTPTSHTHTTSQITDFPTLAAVATSGSYDSLTDEPTVRSASNGSTERSLVTRGEKYLWNNGLITWYTGSANANATSVSIVIDNDMQDVVVMLADDGTGKAVKWTSVTVEHSMIIDPTVTITFPALASNTSFKIGMV